MKAPQYFHRELDGAIYRWCKMKDKWHIVKEDGDSIIADCTVCGQRKMVIG